MVPQDTRLLLLSEDLLQGLLSGQPPSSAGRAGLLIKSGHPGAAQLLAEFLQGGFQSVSGERVDSPGPVL
ncbi:unnamed protein product [Larinioides sclopetarius]|uniref:Histone H3 n=1 Tax=Larinioides sclopetarius TaxID=280406 RepID=A0AAV1Z6C1_9ARAC